ncbi:MAG TPA: hypothetical protein VHR55_13070 [Candidatus Limnocylindria bacterium]|nr:hypothetical protein [Candidatus Limnocylindria bacterium]
MTARRRALVALPLLATLVACRLLPSPSPPASPTPPPSSAEPSAAASVEASVEASLAPSAASATPTPPPELGMELPETRDPRVVDVTINPTVDGEGGEILVRVVSGADSRVDDLVVRWPADLAEYLHLAPFVPSEDRIRDEGDPLVQPWTKWVLGPGEHGEPAGTISLGYGPLFPGATLEVRIFASRRAPGPVAFDLHVLAGNDLLTLADGQPAVFRVEIP